MLGNKVINGHPARRPNKLVENFWIAVVARDVSAESRSVVITQNGEAKVVVMDVVATCSRWRVAMALLELVAQGEAEAHRRLTAGRQVSQQVALARAAEAVEYIVAGKMMDQSGGWRREGVPHEAWSAAPKGRAPRKSWGRTAAGPAATDHNPCDEVRERRR